jgi:hypothetical protein
MALQGVRGLRPRIVSQHAGDSGNNASRDNGNFRSDTQVSPGLNPVGYSANVGTN